MRNSVKVHRLKGIGPSLTVRVGSIVTTGIGKSYDEWKVIAINWDLSPQERLTIQSLQEGTKRLISNCSVARVRY
jgi:hypothetical protein